MAAVNLSGLPHVPLRVLVFAIFVLCSWATLSTIWLGISYIMANYFILLLGIWAERDTSPIPVQFFFFGVAFTFLNDILSVAINMGSFSYIGSTARFNAAMAIILIIVKPVIGLFAYKEWQDRTEGGGSGGNSNYETLGGQGAAAQGGYTGGFDNKSDMPPQYQPPNNQPFP